MQVKILVLMAGLVLSGCTYMAQQSEYASERPEAPFIMTETGPEVHLYISPTDGDVADFTSAKRRAAELCQEWQGMKAEFAARATALPPHVAIFRCVAP